MIKLKTCNHFDRDGLNCDTFSMLVPDNWNIPGGLIWQNHPTMPSILDLSIQSPDGLDEVRFLPAKSYTWINNMPMFYYQFPKGSDYMGSEIRLPVSSFDEYIRKFYLPDYGNNIAVMDIKSCPSLLNPSGPKPVTA